MPAKWDWPLASPLKLQANGVAIDWNPDPKSPRLPSGPIAKQGPPETDHADSLRLHQVPRFDVPNCRFQGEIVRMAPVGPLISRFRTSSNVYGQ